MQLMHEYVQKSTRTTLPRSPAIVSGSELSQCSMPENSGATGPTGRPETGGTEVAFAAFEPAGAGVASAPAITSCRAD